jgi:DNA mismatch repair ATPase MutS
MTEKKSQSLVIPETLVTSKIYIVRNKKIMLDRDLAELYEVETKVLNQAVKRNIERFPEEFMFQLTPGEFEILKSQIVTSSWGGTRYLPMAFTEYGVAMLSSVLRSRKAIEVNIQIMLIFSKIREMLVDTLSMKLDIEKIKRRLSNQDKNLELVFSYLDELITKKENLTSRRPIGFKSNSDQPSPDDSPSILHHIINNLN